MTVYGQALEGALEAGLSVVIGVGAGYYADRLFGTHPFLLVALTVAGAIASVRRLLQLAKLGQPEPASAEESAEESENSAAALSATAPTGTHPRGSGPEEADPDEPGPEGLGPENPEDPDGIGTTRVSDRRGHGIDD